MGRCQAILLTKQSRKWSKVRPDYDPRCTYNAKEGVFCKSHAHMGDVIDFIVWKEDNGSGTQEG